jgi:hypothetical protein
MEGLQIGLAIVAIIGLLTFKYGYLEEAQFKENTFSTVESGTIADKRIKTEVDGGVGFASGSSGFVYVPTSTSESFLVTVKGSGFIKELEVSHEQYLNVNKGDKSCIKNWRLKLNKEIVKSEIEDCK